MSAAEIVVRRGRFQPGQSGNPAGTKVSPTRRRVKAMLADIGATEGEMEALTNASGDPVLMAVLTSLLVRRLRELPAVKATAS